MRKYYLLGIFTGILSLFIYSCSSNDNEEYVEPSPVTVDLTQVPYAKLSDYHFFKAPMSAMVPEKDVHIYEPISQLFTDYAHKKRFVWLPPGTKATYNGDGSVLELPVGAAIIKNFYYDELQPTNTRKIIETRIMIRKSNGWIFAEYVWNDEQTEAFFDINGSNRTITFTENGVQKTANYRIPNEAQCVTCHKLRDPNTNIYSNSPIGIKPQNINFNYNYGAETKNQLAKWKEWGILESNAPISDPATAMVDYKDVSKPLEQRVRSYFDINCAHCHSEKGHCYYRPMRMSFDETNNNLTNMGVCVPTADMQDFPPALIRIVSPNNINRSMLYYRLNTENESFMMPLHGRSIIHEEGVLLVKQWIESLQPCN